MKKNMLIYYQQKKKEREVIFLSKILIRSNVIIHYILEENIFVVNVYKLLVQKKHLNFVSETALKLMDYKE